MAIYDTISSFSPNVQHSLCIRPVAHGCPIPFSAGRCEAGPKRFLPWIPEPTPAYDEVTLGTLWYVFQHSLRFALGPGFAGRRASGFVKKSTTPPGNPQYDARQKHSTDLFLPPPLWAVSNHSSPAPYSETRTLISVAVVRDLTVRAAVVQRLSSELDLSEARLMITVIANSTQRFCRLDLSGPWPPT